MLLQGNTGAWEIVIGLEVHAQIASESKLFSGASSAFGAEPNANVSFVDAAMPGMLPVLNKRCIFQAVKTGLALGAVINKRSVFDRKNYFYADLPQGYQISQFRYPLVGEGSVTVTLENGDEKTIRIERIHVEQDAGKSLHDRLPTESLIDLNRSGVGLMEIVSKPDMRSPEEAAAYLAALRAVMRAAGTCDGDMEKGSMRCDANVSVRPVGSDELRTRCEIKNLNSLRFLRQAILYEARRHIALYEEGAAPFQETRLFDSDKGETRGMRGKEDAHDYRYFPDPDLPPLVIDDALIEAARAELPELPDAKRRRYAVMPGVSGSDAFVLSSDPYVSAYFERVILERKPGPAAGWITGELFGRLNKRSLTLEQSPVDAERLSGLLAKIEDGTVSGKIAKDVLDLMFESSKSADAIIEEQGLRQVSDSGELEAVIAKLLLENADKAAEYRSGKEKLFGFFVGQAMKLTQGKANPQMINDLLRQALS